MSLTLNMQPGFTAVADTQFAAGLPITDSLLKQMNDNAEFAAVRNEQFYGYYRDGETVVLPVSPADGYQYSRSELVYSFGVYWSGAAAGACNGTMTAPPRGATTGQGTLLQYGYSVDPATGVVSCATSYYKTGQTDTNDGILFVVTHAQRQR